MVVTGEIEIEKKGKRGKKEMGEERKMSFFIIFYWDVCKNKNYDVGKIVKWVSKINKVVFEDAK